MDEKKKFLQKIMSEETVRFVKENQREIVLRTQKRLQQIKDEMKKNET